MKPKERIKPCIRTSRKTTENVYEHKQNSF